jgi:hypothetical protein
MHSKNRKILLSKNVGYNAGTSSAEKVGNSGNATPPEMFDISHQTISYLVPAQWNSFLLPTS